MDYAVLILKNSFNHQKLALGPKHPIAEVSAAVTARTHRHLAIRIAAKGGPVVLHRAGHDHDARLEAEVAARSQILESTG
jgi:hypothetical protein